MIKEISIILILFFSFSNCSQKKENTVEKNWEFEQFAKHKTFSDCCKKIPRVKFKETNELKVGDELLLFGGDNRFFQKITGKKELRATIVNIYFIKAKKIAIIKFENDLLKTQSIDFTVSLTYYTKVKGYEPFQLYIWEEKIDKEKLKLISSEGQLDIKNEIVDLNIGFKNLSTKD